MKRSHPTILNPIHNENVRQPSDHLNIYFMHLCARQASVCCTYQGGSLTRHLRIFAAHLSFPFVSAFTYPILVFDKRMSYLLQPHMYTFAHKKKRSCIETPSFTQVCSYPVIGFSRAPSGKGYLGGYLIERTHEFDPSNFFPIISFVLHLLERLRNMGPGKGRAVVIICFYVYNLRGGLPYHLCFPVENDPAFSRAVVVLCLFILQGVKQGGGSQNLLFNHLV